MTDMIGKRVNDRYELIAVVGGGGMAVVYKAHDLILDRTVAVKILRAEFSDDEEFISRFRREAMSASSLSHANIVSIYDIGDDDEDLYYIVMEYIEGETLKDLIKREAPLALGRSLHIMEQVTLAIAHAHDHGIIHRDIKPHNIMLSDGGTAKVTDFGIAVAMTSVTMTRTNSVIGSAHYFSPEQAKGKYADFKSDIYSLGIVLYEMLTGELPFSGTSPISVALKHVQEDIKAPRTLNESIPQSVENVILKALSKEPFYRYETVMAMKQDIDTALEPDRLNEAKFQTGSQEVTTKVMPVVSEESPSSASQSETEADYESTSGHESAEKQSKKKPAIITILLLLLVGCIVAAAIFIPKWMQVEKVTIPDVVGEAYANVGQLFADKNLQIVKKEVVSGDVKKGHIIKQKPQAKTSVKPGSTVKLFVSKGPDTITMKNFMGETKERVKLLLQSYDFKDVTFQGEYNSDYPEGIVFEQYPKPNQEVVPGETVLELTYSKGSNVVEVPNLKGIRKKRLCSILMNWA